MTLIVSDATGRRYRPTGQFREPKQGEHLYCFDHKRVEVRPEALAEASLLVSAKLNGTNAWCSNAHIEFLLHRIICEPLPVEYEVTVRLTQADFEYYSNLANSNWDALHASDKKLARAILSSRYREVPRASS